MLRVPPPRQHALDIFSDAISRFPTLDAARQEHVIACFRVADVRGDRELHRIFVQTLGGRRSADAPAVLLTRVPRDCVGAIFRTRREQLAYPTREARKVLSIELGPPFRFTPAAPGSCLSIVQALGFSALKRVLLHEQSLALVPPARATPFQHHRGERRVFAGAPREGSIARRQKYQVIEICTGEAERAAIAGQKNQRPGAEIFAAFVTARLAG